MNDDPRRCGKFQVAMPNIEGHTQMIHKVFHRLEMIPLYADYDEEEKLISCMGISHLFRSLAKGEAVPEYIIGVEDNDGPYSVTVTEKLSVDDMLLPAAQARPQLMEGG